MPSDPPSDATNRIQLPVWHPLRQNTLRGFATVRIEPPGLIVRDIPVHRNGGSLYALMPGKPQINKDGQVLIDEHGKRKYVPVVEVPERDVRERLSNAVVDLVLRHDPEAFT